MRVTMLLADFAQVADGKLYVAGGGWSLTGPSPIPHAVAIKIEVPWDQANTKHHFVLEMLSDDGKPVAVSGPMGPQPIRIEGNFEPGRPPGLKPGVPLDVCLALNIGALPLAPDSRFTWHLTIDDDHQAEWELGFATRPGQIEP